MSLIDDSGLYETISGKQTLRVSIAGGSTGSGGVTISITPRGDYESGTLYNVGDLVFFEGLSYIAIQQTTGNNPTDTAFWQLLADAIKYSFESISKNLKSWNTVINKNAGGDITSIVYTSGAESVTKTFNYNSGNLISLVLSGDTPASIALTKTFTYSGGDIVGWSYS